MTAQQYQVSSQCDKESHDYSREEGHDIRGQVPELVLCFVLDVRK